MIKVNIHEAKTHLSSYLRKLRQGEILLICKRNLPIAEVRLLASPRKKKRPVGLAKGEFAVGSAFFEPLPEETLVGFRGGVS